MITAEERRALIRTMAEAVGEVLRDTRAELRQEIRAAAGAGTDALYRSALVKRLQLQRAAVASYCADYLHRRPVIEAGPGDLPPKIARALAAAAGGVDA